MSSVLELSSTYDTPIFTLKYAKTTVKDAFGAVYHGKTRTWWFPAFYPVHQYVLSDLKKLVPELQLSSAVEAHLRLLSEEPALPDTFSFITPPYDHQYQGLLHLYRNLRAGLFYDQGLGKCKITVDLQRLLDMPFMIVCPRIMLPTWAEEFEKHGGIKDVVIINGATPKKKLAQIQQVRERPPAATVLTYGVAARYAEQLLHIPYKALVLDESHRIKQPHSKRTKAITALGAPAHRRILLSGTPTPGSPFDVYGQLRFLGKYFCPENWWAFRKKFGVFHPAEEKLPVPKMVLGYKNVEVLNKRLALVCLRKTREECLDLPDRVITDIRFGLFPEQKQLYNTLIKERTYGAGYSIYEAQLSGELGCEQGSELAPHVIVSEVITLLGKLDQVSSGFLYMSRENPALCNRCEHVFKCTENKIKPYTNKCVIAPKHIPGETLTTKHNARLDACLDLLDDLIETPTNKVIIWATFKQELEDIANALRDRKISFVRVQGGASDSETEQAVHAFNNDSACRVYLAQVSTGIGITLNAATYMIYYSLPWSLEHYLQSMDRNYRIGQSKKVVVYRLLGAHTLDYAKMAALDAKVDFSTLLTQKNVCALCSHYHARCSKYKINLYDDECIYDRVLMKESAKVSLIP